jgi:shikimate dehydrogenase
MKYGLIGKNISYSYSKEIHTALNLYQYSINSLDENQVIELLKTKDFLGINVTIPYKKLVIDYLDEVSDEVKQIGACNCIVNTKGKLIGYNTDFYGLRNLITCHHINVQNKKCYILGSGGTKNTAEAVLKSLGVSDITIVSRSKNEHTITYEEFFSLHDAEILINTTPRGTYPNIDDSLITLEQLKQMQNLKAIFDVVYNPLTTRLVQYGRMLKIPSYNGLEMLVDQALAASEKFIGAKIDLAKRNEIVRKIINEKSNLVLIGLPMSGKSTIGKVLATQTNKTFVDLDEELQKEAKMSINEIFATFGEKYFRELESQMIKKFALQNNLVISCGGGVVLNEENMFLLKANGYIIHLHRDEELLIYSATRPLTKDKNDYLKLKQQRIPLYQKYQDIEIDNSSTIDKCSAAIMEAFNESINY